MRTHVMLTRNVFIVRIVSPSNIAGNRRKGRRPDGKSARQSEHSGACGCLHLQQTVSSARQSLLEKIEGIIVIENLDGVSQSEKLVTHGFW